MYLKKAFLVSLLRKEETTGRELAITCYIGNIVNLSKIIATNDRLNGPMLATVRLSKVDKNVESSVSATLL